MELKSKLASAEIGLPGDGVLGDVVSGLMSLGYTAAEAREVVKNLDATGKSSEQLLKEALQRIK